MHRTASSLSAGLAVAAAFALVAGLLAPPASGQDAEQETGAPAGAVSADLVTVGDTQLVEQPLAEFEIGRARGELAADVEASEEDGDVEAHALAGNLDAELLEEVELAELLVHAEQTSPPDADAAATDELLTLPENPLLAATVARARARALTGGGTGCPGVDATYTDANADLAGAEVLPGAVDDDTPLLALTGRDDDDVVSSNGVIELVDRAALDGDAVRSVATADLAAVEIGGWQIGVVSQPRLAVTSLGPIDGLEDAEAAMNVGLVEWTAPVLEIRNPEGEVEATLDAAEEGDTVEIPGVATISGGTVELTEDGSDGTLAAEGELFRLDVADELADVAHTDIAVAPLSASATTPAGGVDCLPIDRVEGPTRIETGVEVSEDAFDSADAAVLARSDDFPDALTASSLAAEISGPILVNPPDALRDDVADELERLGVEEVYLAGGTEALSAQVADDVEALGIDTTRLDGNTRYHTAELIAREVADLGGPVDHVVVARDNLFPDALAAGNLATWARAPILLTPNDRLHGNSEEAMTDSDVVAGQDAFIAGNTAAVGSSAEIDVREAGFAVERLGGAERYATAVAILERAEELTEATFDPLYAATGRDFSDALVAAPAAHATGGSLALVDGADLDISHATRDFLAARRDEVGQVKIVGGTAAISESVVEQIVAILEGE
jgi:putative cell wall-binding protein